MQQVLPLSGGAGLRLTIAKYYTPSGKLIHRNYRDKSKADEGGIWPDVEVDVTADEDAKVLMQYNNIVYTPGKEAPKLKFDEKDKVLEKAVEILTGKISLEEAKEKSKQEAAARKAKKEEQETDKKDKKDSEEVAIEAAE